MNFEANKRELAHFRVMSTELILNCEYLQKKKSCVLEMRNHKEEKTDNGASNSSSFADKSFHSLTPQFGPSWVGSF